MEWHNNKRFSPYQVSQNIPKQEHPLIYRRKRKSITGDCRGWVILIPTLVSIDFLLKDTEKARCKSDMANWEVCGPLGVFSWDVTECLPRLIKPNCYPLLLNQMGLLYSIWRNLGLISHGVEGLDRKWKVWEHRWCFHFSLHLKAITLERMEKGRWK